MIVFQYYWIILKMVVITDFKTILGLMGEKLEACVQLQSYDGIGITEM